MFKIKGNFSFPFLIVAEVWQFVDGRLVLAGFVFWIKSSKIAP